MKERWWMEISLADQNMSGSEALQVRHAIEDQIEAAGIGEVIGGGCNVDGTGIDIELEVEDAEAAREFFDAFLDHCELKDKTTIAVKE